MLISSVLINFSVKIVIISHNCSYMKDVGSRRRAIDTRLP